MRDAIAPAAVRVGSSSLLLPVLLLCAAPRLGAQGLDLALDGTVRGDDGAVLPQAELAVVSPSTGAARRLRVDARGRYFVLALSPGTYDVTAYALGYRPLRRSGVMVVVGERTHVDFTLARSAADLAPIVVTADRHADIRRADISTAVLPGDIRDLPLNARNVLDVAIAAPGVRTRASSGGGVPQAGPSDAGRFGNVYLDGIELKSLVQSNLVGMPASGSIVSQEAIEEFRIMLDPYDVEWGHAAAWVVSAVTRQGSNDLHGSLFAFGQNRELVATRSFASENPRYARGQLGGTVRGPVIRDRVFFAMTVERQQTDNFITVVPGRPPAAPDRWSAYAGTYPAPVRDDMATLRLTAPLGSHVFDLSSSARDLKSSSGFGVRSGTVVLAQEAGTAARYTISATRLRDSWVAGRFANEFAVELLTNRSDERALRPGPAYRYVGLQLGISTLPTRSYERHLGVTEKAAVAFDALGMSHVLKLGGGAQRTHGIGFQPINRDGLFSFATDTSILPAQGTIGIGYYDSTGTSDARGTNDGWLLHAYAQDQLHPVEQLTLTVGLRWDADLNTLNQAFALPFAGDTTLQRVVGDRYLNDGDRRNTLDNFAPRVSAVWDVGNRDRIFVRGGYGISYDRVPVYGAFWEQLFWRWRSYVIQNPGTTNPDSLRAMIGSSAPSLHLLPDRMATPYTRQWSIGIGRRLGDGATVNADYVDQRLQHVYVTVRRNVAPQGGQRPLTTRYGDLFLWGDFGAGTYRGLLTSLTVDRQRSRFNIAYTLSSARTNFNIVSTNDFPDPAEYRMQRSVADERHRIVVTEAASLPWALSAAAIGVLASPRPYLVTIGSDVNRNGVFNDDWPNGMRTARNGGSNNWYRDLDLRVEKGLRVSEGMLALSGEVFNVFNVGNHSDYQGVQRNLGYGKAINDYPRRQAQLGVRYSF